MKVLTLKKRSSITSFAVSVLMHGLLVIGVGFWSRSSEKEFDLVKLPNMISINLNGVRGNGKERVNAPVKKVVASSASSSASSFSSSTQSTQSSSVASATTGGTGASGSKEGSLLGSDNGVSDAVVLSMKQKYFLEFRNTIESKKEYPTLARMRGIEGTVVVSVTIKKTGEVLNHKVLKASGFDVLDQSALSLVRKINMFKSFPSEFGGEDIELKFPIAYSLNG